MKKIFTLLVTVGLLTAAANAQTGTRDRRDYPQNDQRTNPQTDQRDSRQYDQRTTPQPDQRDSRQYDQRTTPQPDQRDSRQYDQRTDQQNSQWNKDNGYRNDNDDRYNKNGSYGSIEMQVAQINRKYDFQVQRVRNDFFIRRFEKMRTIRSLEYQRQQEIRMVYARSNRNRDWQHDRGYDSNRRY